MNYGYLVRALNEFVSLTCPIRGCEGDESSNPTSAAKQQRHKGAKSRRLREQPKSRSEIGTSKEVPVLAEGLRRWT
jgi:hypothetical protein